MIFDIRDYGAVGDGKTLNTEAFQKAIDACVSAGGGRVLLEDGIYMTGSIVLGNGVDLHIASNATLLGSPECSDYPEHETQFLNTERLPRWRNASLIYAEQVENISITGMGKIDCNGKSFVVEATPENRWGGWTYTRIDAPTPPRVVFFAGCKNVKVEDVTMVNQPAGWSYWIHDCDYVSFDKVKIFAEVEYPNNDGIHINCSRNVTISNCCITCGDDCIIVRANSASLKENKVCEKVTVNNCNLTSYASGIRMGWSRDGVIKNCVFSNIVMTDTTAGIVMSVPDFDTDPQRKVLWTADTGRERVHMENISFHNIIMNEIYGNPIIIQAVPSAKISAIKNIYFNGVRADSLQHIKIEGQADKPIENVRFHNCDFEIINKTDFGDRHYHGAENLDGGTKLPIIKNVKGIVFNNTTFTVRNDKENNE